MIFDLSRDGTSLKALNRIKDYITNNAKSSAPVGNPADYGNETIFLKKDESYKDFQIRMNKNKTLKETFSEQFGSTDDLFKLFDKDNSGTLTKDEAQAFYDLASTTSSYTDAAALTNEISKYEKTNGTTVTPNENEMGLSPDAQMDFIDSLEIPGLTIESYEKSSDGSLIFTSSTGTKLTCTQDPATGEYKVKMKYTDNTSRELTYDSDKNITSMRYKDKESETLDVFGEVDGERKVVEKYKFDPKDKNPNKAPIGFSMYNEDSGEIETIY